jgi:hypothetical protein
MKARPVPTLSVVFAFACLAILALAATGSARVAPTISVPQAKSLTITTLKQKTNFGSATKKSVSCSTAELCSVGWRKGNEAYSGNTEVTLADDATAQNYVYHVEYTVIRYSIKCGTSRHCIKPAYSGYVNLPTGVAIEY